MRRSDDPAHPTFLRTDARVADRRERRGGDGPHQELAVTQFTKTRAANLVVPVPIERLAAGEYLLTLRAELNGTAVRRDTRLRVR